MSRDIRSFFLSKKTAKPKAEEDEDVIPESPDVQVQNKKKARKKRVLSDDSDEEIFATKKKKTINESAKPKKKSPAKPVLKEVKAADIFGSGPINRTEPLVKKVKEKKNTETGIHSDDEFDKSLLELDGIDELEAQSEEKGASSTVSNKSDAVKDEISKEKSPIKSKEESDKNDVKLKSKKESKPESKSHKSKVDNENKRKFAEFIDENVKDEEQNTSKKDKEDNKEKTEKAVKKERNGIHVDVEDSFNDSVPGSGKKKKMNKSLNESVLTDEEKHERKMHSVALYKNYLNRTGPKHLGAKEIPEGAPDYLKDCAFLLTGVLDSFEREEVTEAIAKYGGCVKNSISKKVTHVLAGEEAGPAKMAKAQELGIKIINEDEFLKMIRDSTSKRAGDSKPDVKKEKSPSRKSNIQKVKRCIFKESINGIKKSSDTKHEKKSKGDSSMDKNQFDKKLKDHVKEIKSEKLDESKVKIEIENKLEIKTEKNVDNLEQDSEGKEFKSCQRLKSTTPSIMWVDKYKPQNLKQIIGQYGEASNVKKLSNWLSKWYINRKAKLPKPSPWAKNDDGAYYKAALLSGPPGVGKTTTVSLVCKELGFDVVEFNASDTRSKTLIKEQISELLSTTSLSGYAEGNTGKQAVTKKHVLVMDEVDGMAGNEDRGGLQELINLIKATSVPIVCMCNDRSSQKMRSLVNYCYDLRFSRPRVDQIKSAMMSICFKEGVKVPPDALTQLVVAAGQDVRQTLHLLSMWAADPASADPNSLRKDAAAVRKDVKLGPWEAVRKVFSAEDHKSMSIHDKSDLFFYDYSLAPLFVQENYLQVAPHCPKKEILDRVSRAADSISIGDLVDARIRGSQAWGLLPLQAMYSSVIPGHAMSGHMAGQIQFPGWLGKHARAGKMRRLAQEVHAHTRLSTTGSKSSIFLDYSRHLRDAILTPLMRDRTEGIEQAMNVLQSYHLLREDLDSLVELSQWPGQRDPMALVDTKVKAAMTRTYNKNATALPYAPGSIKKGRAHNVDADEYEEEADDANDAEDSDPENEALIKKKKTKETEKPCTSKENPGSSKQKKEKKKK